MNVSASLTYASDEVVQFIQNRLPGMDDGEYQLTVSQRVDDSAGHPISDDSLQQVYTFAVLGDRFRLTNPATVYAVFPPDNDRGEFTTSLPHAVFTQSTLPWARRPTVDAPEPAPGADVPTWLAVLLLDDDDVARYPSLSLMPATATIGDLFPPSVAPGSTLGDEYSYFSGAADTSGLDPGEQLSDPIQVLDIPLGLFWAVAPTLADLGLLAHVRRVSLLNKPTQPGVSDLGEPVGEFSIVFGNRLPAGEKRSSAFLVSLEGLERFLPTDGGASPDPSLLPTSMLRLAVLKSWRFFSVIEAAEFTDQVLRLNGRDPTSQTDAPDTNVRVPYGGVNAVVANALDAGYVPVDHELRTGGRTVSWYRGPLVPYATAPDRVPLPIPSADAALVFDPTTGMFDTSYAAAWTLGRMMALQDPAFSTALYQWKRGVGQKVVSTVETQIMTEAFTPIVDQVDDRALAAPVGMPDARHLLYKVIRTLASPPPPT